MIAIFDIDGVLADNSETRHLDCTEPVQHAQFARIINTVRPLAAGVDLLCALAAAGAEIYIFTARSEALRLATESWLAQNGIPYRELFMRGFGRGEPPARLKRDMLNKLLASKEGEPYCSVIAFDDDKKTVLAFKEAGVTAFLAYDLKRYLKE